MRVGAMVIGILFAIWTFFEALILGGLSNSENDETMSTATGIGFMAAVFTGIAAALVLAVPLLSAILFVVASLLSFGAASSGYGNHWVYAFVFLGLGVMAFFGWIGKRKDRREKRAEQERQRDRDTRMESLLQQRSQPTSSDTVCPSCDQSNPIGTRFCGNCGTALSAVAT